jgi:hypothetical protein
MRGPRAESAHYDAGRNRIIVRLTTGVEIDFAPRDAEGLQGASADDLRSVEVEAFGLGIHFPTLDADLYVPALLGGLLVGLKDLDGRTAVCVRRTDAHGGQGDGLPRERQGAAVGRAKKSLSAEGSRPRDAVANTGRSLGRLPVRADRIYGVRSSTG